MKKFLWAILVLNLWGIVIGVSDSYPIEHVVVLMLENRAFDHMLGFLKQSNRDIDGLNGNETNPVKPFLTMSPEVMVDDKAPYVTISPGHGVTDSSLQIFGGPQGMDLYPPLMNGFVASALAYSGSNGADVMKCFNQSSVPAISTLAQEFALFDHWYSSVPGPTEVNRLYVHSATSHGMGTNDLVTEIGGLPQKPIYQSLSEADISWSIYFEEVTSVLFLSEMRDPKYFDHYKQFEFFEYDANNGYLPSYSFLEPRYFDFLDWYANDQHPSHSVAEGDMLIKTVYEILRNSPVWNSTLLIITYDEHGGFYDHVPPPMMDVPNPDGLNSTDPLFNFTRLGVRVPAIAISPWINKGTVIHEPTKIDGAPQYEHSSILSTIKQIFNLDSFLTKRDAWATSFEDIVLQRETPRTDCPKTLPSPPESIKRLNEWLKEDGPINDLQKSWLELAGSLNGDDKYKYIETEYEGAKYCKKQFYKFLGWNYEDLY